MLCHSSCYCHNPYSATESKVTIHLILWMSNPISTIPLIESALWVMQGPTKKNAYCSCSSQKYLISTPPRSFQRRSIPPTRMQPRNGGFPTATLLESPRGPALLCWIRQNFLTDLARARHFPLSHASRADSLLLRFLNMRKSKSRLTESHACEPTGRSVISSVGPIASPSTTEQSERSCSIIMSL